MDSHLIWELIGYLGSALVLVSLLMSSIIKLRIINAIGSLIFCIYAFKINSIPTAIMNICLVGIDLYFLYKLIASGKTFSCVYASPEDAIVRHFIAQNSADIVKYFGTDDISNADTVIVTLDGSSIAGVTAGITDGEGLRVIIDYTTVQYRDCSVAKYLYGVMGERFRTVSYTGSSPDHVPYCLKMGYEKTEDGYVKTL